MKNLKKRKEYLARSALKGWEFRENVLQKEIPFLFGKQRRPLAIGAFQQLRAMYPDISYNALKMFIREWTDTKTYQTSLIKESSRYNLDGSISEKISEEHAQKAKIKLDIAKRKAKQAKKRKR